MEKSPFQFTNPILRALRMQLNEGFSVPREGSLPAETHFSSHVELIPDAPSAIVSLTFQMGRTDNQFPFILEAKMAAQFMWAPETPPQTLEIWLSQNAPALLLGYMRPIVANTISATGFPPYNIPFMNFTAGHNKVKQPE